MNQKKEQFIKTCMGIIDIGITIVSFFLAYWIRNLFFEDTYGLLQGVDYYLWILGIIIPLWPILLSWFKVYDLNRDSRFNIAVTALFRLVPAVLVGELALSSTFYFRGDNTISRLFYGIFGIVNLILLWIGKIVTDKMWTLLLKKKSYYQRMIIVGTQEKAREFTCYIQSHPQLLIDIIGYVQVEEQPSRSDLKVLGSIENLIDIIKKDVVDEVVFALPKDYRDNIEDLIIECENMGITVHMVLELYDLKLAKTEVATTGEFPILTFHTVNFSPWQMFLKRVLDIIGALVGLMITGMALIFIAPAIRLESEGPIFFGQYRVGKNGRKFRFYKFRSMYKDAEERKKALMTQNEMQGHMFKMKDDPRITKVGKFLRDTSLDELPQFWNILKGDMSLVGTRPPTVDEVEHYENYHRRRISIKPGLTGMWQVSGRSDITDFEEVVKLDVEYIDNWSIWLDIKILFQTVFTVLRKKGSR